MSRYGSISDYIMSNVFILLELPNAVRRRTMPIRKESFGCAYTQALAIDSH